MFQVGTGLFYPLFLAPMASFMYATRHFTYRLPSITEDPKGIFKLFLKFTKSAGTLTAVLFGLNAVVAMLVTAKGMSEYANVQNKLVEHERRIDAGLDSELDVFQK